MLVGESSYAEIKCRRLRYVFVMCIGITRSWENVSYRLSSWSYAEILPRGSSVETTQDEDIEFEDFGPVQETKHNDNDNEVEDEYDGLNSEENGEKEEQKTEKTVTD